MLAPTERKRKLAVTVTPIAGAADAAGNVRHAEPFRHRIHNGNCCFFLRWMFPHRRSAFRMRVVLTVSRFVEVHSPTFRETLLEMTGRRVAPFPDAHWVPALAVFRSSEREPMAEVEKIP